MRGWALWAIIRAGVFAALYSLWIDEGSLFIWLWAICTMMDLESTIARIRRRELELGSFRD